MSKPSRHEVIVELQRALATVNEDLVSPDNRDFPALHRELRKLRGTLRMRLTKLRPKLRYRGRRG